MATGDLTSLPLSPKQLRSIAECEHARINIWTGAVRSGKTIASLLALLIGIAKAPSHGLVAIVGKTLQTIERNVVEPLQDPSLWGDLAGQTKHTRGSNTAVILGRTIHLLGANDIKAEGKLRGATACLIYVDEATLLPEAMWTQALARLSVPGARLLATTNPDGRNHWLRAKYLLRTGELDLRSWHFVLSDNPSLDPKYVAALKTEYTGLWYRRMILGEWCLAEGAVFDGWDDTRHVVDELPQIEHWIGTGVDYGTVNPFAAISLGIGTGPDAVRRLYLTHEWRWDSKTARRQMTDPEYSAALRRWIAEAPVPGQLDAQGEPTRGHQPPWIYVDPSAASFSLQLHADGQVNVAHADNEVLPGIRTVAGLIATDRLRVHRSCHGWIDEVPGYSWDDKAAALGEDKPVKDADHSLDAGRYVIHSTAHLWRHAITPVVDQQEATDAVA